MGRIQIIGWLYLTLSAIGILLYGILLLRFPLPVLMITAFLLIIALGGILGWVGFVMLKTPRLEKK